MSIRLMAAIWEDPTIENATERLLLLALADHANDEGVCWPTIDQLAKRACVSAGQTTRLIAKLVADGRIKADRRGGRHRASTYWLIIKNTRTDAGVSDEETRASTPETRASTHERRVPTQKTRASTLPQPPTTTNQPSPEPPTGVGGLGEGACPEGGEGEAAPAAPGHDAATTEVPADVLAVWDETRWPLTDPLCKYLANAARTYSAGELLAAIEIMHDSPKPIERPAAYLKRVLQRRASAVVDVAIWAANSARVPKPPPELPADVQAVRRVLAGYAPHEAERWGVEVDGEAVTVEAGIFAEWLRPRTHMIEKQLSIHLRRQMSVSVTAGRLP